MPLLRIALVLLAGTPAAAPQELKSVLVADGVPGPTFLTQPRGDDRLFVTGRRDGVFVIKDGAVAPEMFLDLRDEIGNQPQGLMSLAFHPRYAENGLFYVVYLDEAQVNHLVEYRVSRDDPDRADPSSARHVLPPEPQPAPSLNWNHAAFGPDGMLYVATGDGGWVGGPDLAQSLGRLYGKLLRLDVNRPPPHVPPDNPFVGVTGARGEIWARGLRQPWRFDFDDVNGDLYIADVGEQRREEIDYVRTATSTGGGWNFGWACMEGNVCTETGACECFDAALARPLHTYDHTAGCAVIGGFVYRGRALRELRGAYFYADHCGGRVFSLRHDGARVTELSEWTEALQPAAGMITQINSFGEDAQGELYLLDGASFSVHKIVPARTGR